MKENLANGSSSGIMLVY